MVRLAAKAHEDAPQMFRLRTVAFEAMKLTKTNYEVALSWTRGLDIVEIDPEDSTLRFVAINIPTIRGTIRASEGQYITRDADGNFGVMDALEFETKYERV